jgi:hypothetical protein
MKGSLARMHAVFIRPGGVACDALLALWVTFIIFAKILVNV